MKIGIHAAGTFEKRYMKKLEVLKWMSLLLFVGKAASAATVVCDVAPREPVTEGQFCYSCYPRIGNRAIKQLTIEHSLQGKAVLQLPKTIELKGTVSGDGSLYRYKFKTLKTLNGMRSEAQTQYKSPYWEFFYEGLIGASSKTTDFRDTIEVGLDLKDPSRSKLLLRSDRRELPRQWVMLRHLVPWGNGDWYESELNCRW